MPVDVPTNARRGLDALLARYPGLDLVALEQQVDPSDGRSAARWRGPWMLVDLGEPSEQIELEPVWTLRKFAIWRATGDVYSIGANGAVGDDPLIRLEETR